MAEAEEEEEDRPACPFPPEIAVARFRWRCNVAVPSLLVAMCCLPAYQRCLRLGNVYFLFLFLFLFQSTIYYTGRDGSPCLQEELCMEYQYPNLRVIIDSLLRIL